MWQRGKLDRQKARPTYARKGESNLVV